MTVALIIAGLLILAGFFCQTAGVMTMDVSDWAMPLFVIGTALFWLGILLGIGAGGYLIGTGL